MGSATVWEACVRAQCYTVSYFCQVPLNCGRDWIKNQSVGLLRAQRGDNFLKFKLCVLIWPCNQTIFSFLKNTNFYFLVYPRPHVFFFIPEKTEAWNFSLFFLFVIVWIMQNSPTPSLPQMYCIPRWSERKLGQSFFFALFFPHSSFPQSRHQVDIYHKPPLRGLNLKVLRCWTASAAYTVAERSRPFNWDNPASLSV